MKTCPFCSKENEDVSDFCSCGYYFNKQKYQIDSLKVELEEKKRKKEELKSERPPLSLIVVNILSSINVIYLIIWGNIQLNNIRSGFWIGVMVFGLSIGLIWGGKIWGLYILSGLLLFIMFSFGIMNLVVQFPMVFISMVVYIRYSSWLD